jgi:hypothetical protein
VWFFGEVQGMLTSAIKKILLLVGSSGIGVVVGTALPTPVILMLNASAPDGPYFPAPLVALGFLALPIGAWLLLVQGAVVGFEALRRRHLGNVVLLIGIASGLIIGAVWYFVLASSAVNLWGLLAVSVSGSVQALTVFGCHWVAYRIGKA